MEYGWQNKISPLSFHTPLVILYFHQFNGEDKLTLKISDWGGRGLGRWNFKTVRVSKKKMNPILQINLSVRLLKDSDKQ